MKIVVHNIKVSVKFAAIQEVIVVCMDILWFFLKICYYGVQEPSTIVNLY